MRCPNCNHGLPSFSSWRMTPMNPLACKECGTWVTRDGRLQPLLIAVGGIVVYGFIMEFMALNTVGKLFMLGVVVFGAMWLDERTLKLKVVG